MKVRLFAEHSGDYLTRFDVEKKFLFANKDRIPDSRLNHLDPHNGGKLTEDLIQKLLCAANKNIPGRPKLPKDSVAFKPYLTKGNDELWNHPVAATPTFGIEPSFDEPMVPDTKLCTISTHASLKRTPSFGSQTSLGQKQIIKKWQEFKQSEEYEQIFPRNKLGDKQTQFPIDTLK